MKYSAFTVCATLLIAFALPVHAAPASEIHITPDGKFTAKNVVVIQKSENGATFFSRVIWGDIFLRITVLTAPNGVAAKITKNNGGAATHADVKVGDILSVEGTLAPGADTLLINATAVRDHSLNVEAKDVSGVIKTLNAQAGTFTLTDKKLGAITVVAPYNIQKGARTIAVGELAVGDKVLSASGAFDYSTKTFTTSGMEVYQDKSAPATAVVSVGKNDYTVYLAASAKVMSKNKTATTLQRFTAGDAVRFYGAIRQTNLSEIDADLIRNLNF